MERQMRYSARVRPISYLKANAAEVLLDLAATREPMVITQNGEARAVLQDVASFEQTQETLALLKILAIGSQDIEAGRMTPARDVIARLKADAGKR
jgi:prevent-host-death family protein